MSRARTFADLATASEEGSLSKRNMIINGNMEVAQRATSKAVTESGTFVCDRWGVSLSSAGRFTMSQESITDLEGFGKATKLDCTTADTSIASDELLLFYQRFEGQFLQKMQKGFSSAKPVTLSFYVKGNASATYVAELIDSDNSNRHINKSFSVTTSWSRVSLTFPGDTTGKLTADNSASLYLHIWLHAGSNYQGGTLQTSWGALSQTGRAEGITSFFDSTDREFFITGVQMELGEVATPFEHETFEDNLQRCQRYYEEGYIGFGANITHSTHYQFHQHGFNTPKRTDDSYTMTLTVDNEYSITTFNTTYRRDFSGVGIVAYGAAGYNRYLVSFVCEDEIN